MFIYIYIFHPNCVILFFSFIFLIYFSPFLLFHSPAQPSPRVGGRVALPLAGGGAARRQLVPGCRGQSGGGELPAGVEDRRQGGRLSYLFLEFIQSTYLNSQAIVRVRQHNFLFYNAWQSCCRSSRGVGVFLF